MPRSLSTGKSMLAQDLMPLRQSPESMDDVPMRVVVVMDRLKEFSMEPLEWVLKNVANRASCAVTLLGVMPWLNIPLSAKTWSGIWNMNHEDLSIIKEGKNEAKYQKVRMLLDLCQNYGVVPEIRTETGHPLHLLVIEQIGSLHATLVVFDRHHERKYIDFYAEKVPCNMVKMKEDGEVDMIKRRSHINSVESTPGNQNSCFVPPPKLIISEQLKKLLKQRSRRKQDERDWRKTEDAEFSFGMCLSGSKVLA